MRCPREEDDGENGDPQRLLPHAPKCTQKQSRKFTHEQNVIKLYRKKRGSKTKLRILLVVLTNLGVIKEEVIHVLVNHETLLLSHFAPNNK